MYANKQNQNSLNCAMEIVSDVRSIKGTRATPMETDVVKDFKFETPDFMIPEVNYTCDIKTVYPYENVKGYMCVGGIIQKMADALKYRTPIHLSDHELGVYEKMINSEQNYIETMHSLSTRVNAVLSNRTPLRILGKPTYTCNNKTEFIFLKRYPYYKEMEITGAS